MTSKSAFSKRLRLKQFGNNVRNAIVGILEIKSIGFEENPVRRTCLDTHL